MIKKITNFFKTKNPILEEKAASPYSPYAAVMGFYNGFGYTNNPVKWMSYYSTNAPMGDAIDKIASECGARGRIQQRPKQDFLIVVQVL